MPAQEPDGATTYSNGSNASMTCRAKSAACLSAPEFHAGCPQQVCTGTSTSQPACSSSLTAEKPTLGRTRSTRQVTNNATFGGVVIVSGSSFSRSLDREIILPGRIIQGDGSLQ